MFLLECSDDVVAAFRSLVKRCFLLPIQTIGDVDKATSGIRLSSPTTFLRAVQQAAPAFNEPGECLQTMGSSKSVEVSRAQIHHNLPISRFQFQKSKM